MLATGSGQTQSAGGRMRHGLTSRFHRRGHGVGAGRCARRRGGRAGAEAPRDQSEALAEALHRAAGAGRALHLPPGRYRVADVDLPAGAVLTGVPGHSVLELARGSVILFGEGDGIRLSGLGFTGPGGASDSPDGLVSFERCNDVAVTDCSFENAPARGLGLFQTSGRVQACRFRDTYGAAIGGLDCMNLAIEGNDIADCANLGIYLERGTPDADGCLIRANRIARIGWARGGNGEAGNGINLYRTRAVVVSDNVISDCAFSALRLNATHSCTLSGNLCLASGEVAIFSEFGFSGSAISGNVIDGAAAGISITNFDSGGRLATCAGNVIRNIAPGSDTNPDTTPHGILAEADVAITGNVVSGLPGPAMLLGWGPYLRNVTATGNVISDSEIGIGVSVVQGAGAVVVADNVIEARAGGIVGMEWDAVTVPDLAAAIAHHPHVTLGANSVRSQG